MENPSLFFWLAIGVAIIAIIYLIIDSKRVNQRLIDKNEELEALKRAKGLPSPKASKLVDKESSKSTSTAPRVVEKTSKEDLKLIQDLKDAEAKLQTELSASRDDIKKLKQQLYDVKQGYQDLKKENEENAKKPQVADSDVVFDLRQEIVQLQSTIANLKEENQTLLNNKTKQLNESRTGDDAPNEPSAQPPVSTPSNKTVPKTVPPNELHTNDSVNNQDIEKRLAEQEEALKKQFSRNEEKLHKEINNLKSRTKKLGRSLEKERRRADNNDKAYKITQRQLDATNERLAHYEDLMRQAIVQIEELKKHPAGSVETETTKNPSIPNRPTRTTPVSSPLAVVQSAKAAANVSPKSEGTLIDERNSTEKPVSQQTPPPASDIDHAWDIILTEESATSESE